MSEPTRPGGPRTEHVVTQAEAGQTLLALVRQVMGLPWSRAEALITTRRVAVDGVVVAVPAQRLKARAKLVISDQQMKVTRGMLEPERVVYVDPHVLVVNKPAGWMTVPFDADDRDTLIDRAAVWLRRAHAGVDGELGAVQRLDKDTSGLVVFARGFAAKNALARQFDAHSIERRYEALVHGRAHDATYDTWLVKDRGDGMRGSWKASRPGAEPPRDAQRAITHVSLLESFTTPSGGFASRVGCRLETGRTHQIRIHLSEAGCALIGETVYIREHRGTKLEAPRQMLHAAALGFAHPADGRAMRFEAPPPEDFVKVLRRLRG